MDNGEKEKLPVHNEGHWGEEGTANPARLKRKETGENRPCLKYLGPAHKKWITVRKIATTMSGGISH